MIDEINVSNLALIADAQIEPAAGMTAITGETGAGKTALLSSCKLLMGNRADKSLVREGCAEAKVEGRLYVGRDDAVDGTADAGSDDGGEVVVSRRLTADGRSKCKINGAMASVGELAKLVSPEIELCSQNEHQALIKPEAQRAYLDAWAGTSHDGTIDAYKQAWAAYTEAKLYLQDLTEQSGSADARVEEARFVLRRINEVGPDEQDYEELIADLRKAENAEALGRLTSEASAALSEEGAALDALNGALAAMEDAGKFDPLIEKQANQLREALFEVEDVAHEVASYASSFEFDAVSLEQMQQRAADYQALLRSFGPTIADVLKHAEEARETIAVVDDYDAVLAKAEHQLEEAEVALTDAASVLSKKRVKAAKSLQKAVNDTLARLHMGGASLEVSVEKLPHDKWGVAGPDQIAFLFRPAADLSARPLGRIASGGELSRVMLALHVALGAAESASTLVFDEIDAGIGGESALSIADVLVELSQKHQVIVVTHLAQIASKASRQYVAKKVESEGMAETCISLVEGEQRAREIARMLSGSLTDASLTHARELLG